MFSKEGGGDFGLRYFDLEESMGNYRKNINKITMVVNLARQDPVIRKMNVTDIFAIATKCVMMNRDATLSELVEAVTDKIFSVPEMEDTDED